jgi:hypothetical protein
LCKARGHSKGTEEEMSGGAVENQQGRGEVLSGEREREREPVTGGRNRKGRRGRELWVAAAAAARLFLYTHWQLPHPPA